MKNAFLEMELVHEHGMAAARMTENLDSGHKTDVSFLNTQEVQRARAYWLTDYLKSSASLTAKIISSEYLLG